MFDELQKKIESATKSLMDEMEIEFVDFQIKQRGKLVAIIITADKVHGGITIDECSRLNKSISYLIEDHCLIDGEFILEVDSPGLDRPLITTRDFKRNQGREVTVYLLEPLQNKKELRGFIKDVSDNSVILESSKETITIDTHLIEKAMQII